MHIKEIYHDMYLLKVLSHSLSAKSQYSSSKDRKSIFLEVIAYLDMVVMILASGGP
jgi:hypothetical protein